MKKHEKMNQNSITYFLKLDILKMSIFRKNEHEVLEEY